VEELTTTGHHTPSAVGASLPESLRTEARARVLGVTLSAEGRGPSPTVALNAVIDLLRNTECYYIGDAERSTLEESFIGLIKREIPS
jgi:hypothetical protein